MILWNEPIHTLVTDNIYKSGVDTKIGHVLGTTRMGVETDLMGIKREFW